MRPNLNIIKDKPKFITNDSVNMLTVMGSHAYGTNTPTSDWDFYGFIVPPMDIVFPYIKGDIPGFGRQKESFSQYQGQHLMSEEGVEYDLTIYNIVKYFQLCMEGNPNMIDSLFTDRDSLVWVDTVANMVREKRHLFLSQKCYHTFKGMAYSHISRIESRVRVGKRLDVIHEHGYDTKDASHVIRCTLELEQILKEGNLDLKKDSALIKQVKQGKWKKEEVTEFFKVKMDMFERMERLEEFVVPYEPQEDKIKKLLENCLEEAYECPLDTIGFGIRR